MQTFQVGQQVKVHINSTIGYFPGVVVRDFTGDDFAKSCPHVDGEQVVEVRYTRGPFAGRYTLAAAHGLSAL